ncbi:MAG: IS21 family transposase, partial [Desulfobacterales bacterium]|nr:IS21 family transposase [Desulfobacterales bacterium]
MLNLNWRTVKKYLQSSGVPHRYDTSNRKSQLEPYYGIIEQWLSEDQYTASRIFDRLKPLGYAGGYDQVRRLVRKVKGDLGKKAYIRFETEPGKQAQVDFGDFKIKDREGNSVRTVYLFAMILGYSRKLYVELIPRRTMKEFLDCHIRAFAFFGGVPQEILYDRMKNVFIRQMTGAVEWNKLFYSLCIHYQFKPLIAPAYGPWVKGKIEKPMDFVRESFFRGYSYSTLEQANRDLFAWAVRKEKRIHGTTKERIDHRFLKEKPYLGLCPPAVFDTRERHYRKVYKDCTISFGANRYVVPHSYVGKEVTCKTGDRRISIIHNEKTLVTYTIPKGKGHLIQDKRFYAALRRDALQNARKYAFHGRKKKGQATLGITTPNKGAGIIVPTRSISEYSDLA